MSPDNPDVCATCQYIPQPLGRLANFSRSSSQEELPTGQVCLSPSATQGLESSPEILRILHQCLRICDKPALWRVMMAGRLTTLDTPQTQMRRKGAMGGACTFIAVRADQWHQINNLICALLRVCHGCCKQACKSRQSSCESWLGTNGTNSLGNQVQPAHWLLIPISERSLEADCLS